MKRLELIMGRNIPNAGKVSDNMINDFIKTEELIDKGRQWTEDLPGSVEGELLRSFALP